MVKKIDITIPELTGDAVRKAYIYLPASYRTEKEKRYPVLYMFDGHNVFFDSDATYGKSWGMKEYMDRTRTQLIIVAIECNHDPNNGRLIEYTPFPFHNKEVGMIPAKGDITMDWLVHKFKKYIDRRYRTLTDREHTFIAGSSMGGLMSLYALFAYNHVFSGAAALSPSIWTNYMRIEQMVKEAALDADTILYMDYGSVEMERHPGMSHRFNRLCSRLLDRKIYLTSRIVPNGEHCEASWERQIPIFMTTLLFMINNNN